MVANELDIDPLAINQSALAKLLCGNVVENGGGINEVLSYLSTSIDNVVRELINLESLSPNQISLFAPFLGRSILELGCTALITRLDPFRVLLLREHQKQSDYRMDKPNKSSIRWQGDVFPEEEVTNIWSDKSLKNPTRALLGEYYKTLIWSANFVDFSDAIQDVTGDEWIVDLRRKDFHQFYSQTFNELKNLYSELSKGIHHELVIPLSSAFDRETTRQLIERTIRNIATLGLFVSVVSHSLNKLDIQDAITTYKEIQEIGVF
jgi:hypothetical protein